MLCRKHFGDFPRMKNMETHADYSKLDLEEQFVYCPPWQVKRVIYKDWCGYALATMKH